MARSRQTRYARRRNRLTPAEQRLVSRPMPLREDQLQNIFAQGRETTRPTRGGLASDIGARIAESPLARGLGLGPFGASLRDIGTGLPASQIAMAAAGPVALGADVATLGTTAPVRRGLQAAGTSLARQLPRGRTITGEQRPLLENLPGAAQQLARNPLIAGLRPLASPLQLSARGWYSGTRAPPFQTFRESEGVAGHWTRSPETAREYGRVMEGDLTFKNPVTIMDEDWRLLRDWDKRELLERLKRQGYDAAISDDTGDVIPFSAADVKIVQQDIDAVTQKTPARRRPTNRSTVVRPERKRFPGIYRDPREIVGESAQNVAPASPNMPRLFGVTRQDLDEMTRTIGERIPQTDVPVHMGTGRGAQHVQRVMKPANIRRLQDVLEVGSQDPRFAGSYGWYNLEPLMQRYSELFGPEEGMRRFAQFRQLGSGLSPLSDPVTELQRASVAQRAIQQGRPEMFYDVAQLPPARGHMAHRSAHTPAVRRVIEQGALFPEDYPVLKSPKVRHYDAAKSGIVGFPTMDAHFARSIGLPDVRPLKKVKGERIPDVSSVGPVEYGPLREWYRSKVAGPTGIPASPAQALQWNVFGTSTGVEAPLSAPYLELLSDSIARAAYKQGITPETARDLFVAGKLDL